MVLAPRLSETALKRRFKATKGEGLWVRRWRGHHSPDRRARRCLSSSPYQVTLQNTRMPRTWFLLALIVVRSLQANHDCETLSQVSTTIDALLTKPREKQ